MAILVNNQGSPFSLYWTNNYLTSTYRNTNKSINTSSKVLRIIAMAHEWASNKGFDLDAELSQGDFLSMEQIEDLANFLRLNASAQAERFTKSKSKNKVIELEKFLEYRNTDKPTLKTVSAAEGATRIRWIANYMEWHLQRRLGSLDRIRKESDSIKIVGDQVIKRLKSLAPKVRAGAEDESLEGLSKNICILAEEIFLPDSDVNPFKKGFIQERNYLIWRFLLECGLRREELQTIKVEGVNYSTRRISLTKSKTIRRTLPISELSASKFHNFVINYWSKLPKEKKKNGFLFTTKSGDHLNLNSINLIFRTAKKKNLPTFFTPHALRRTFVDRYMELINEQKKLGKKAEIDDHMILNRLLGWGSNSEMGERYGKGQIRRDTDKISQELINALVNIKHE
jgi:integrase